MELALVALSLSGGRPAFVSQGSQSPCWGLPRHHAARAAGRVDKRGVFHEGSIIPVLGSSPGAMPMCRLDPRRDRRRV
jgi:hypothetical protein